MDNKLRPPMYNIPGPNGQVRLTLQQYKDAMGQLFEHFTLELGQFENMIIRDDWCAIRYITKYQEALSPLI